MFMLTDPAVRLSGLHQHTGRRDLDVFAACANGHYFAVTSPHSNSQVPDPSPAKRACIQQAP